MKKLFAILMGVLLIGGTAGAATISLTGHLSDSTDTRIIGPGSSGSGAVFTANPLDSIDNVMAYTFQVIGSGPVRFQTFSFGLGGIDPYFSLFSGAGDPATFVASNYTQAFSTGGDIDQTLSLAAGTYTATLSVFANESLAENAGSGTLADGFTNLGTGAAAGTADPLYYSLQISGGVLAPVPLPGSLGLLALGMSTLVACKKSFNRRS